MAPRSWIRSLSEPFPDQKHPRKNLRTLLGIGLFVSLFLFFLRPFGLHHIDDNGLRLLICMGFGGVMVLFGWCFDLFTYYVLKIRTDVPSWTLAKWIFQNSVLLAWIALGNFCYLSLLMNQFFNWSFLLEMMGNTVLVGIFPIVFAGMTHQMKASRKNREQAQELALTPALAENPAVAKVALASTNEKPLEIPISDLRFAEAMQNYVSISYLSAASLQKEVVRNTLSKLESEWEQTPMVRCHRSYLVNLDAVAEVNGNAQGWKLRLEGVPDFEVPVSRSYIPAVRELLEARPVT
ncbi:MAG: LytR/AlgR family response regulator transcription factor [Salibacteraceae bacterium]